MLNKKTTIRIILIALIGAVFALFFIFDMGQYLSLESMQNSRQDFMKYYSEHQATVIAAYVGIYILVAGLSLPGATVLTLGAGALFGFIIGTIVVSIASTIGATLACFVSRFLLRDFVQRKFADKLVSVNEGIEKEGLFYLFTIRLIPIFPFFAVNLVMGLTKMRLMSFAWVSQVGMLAGTMVYVNAGRELGKLDSLSGILSPSLFASFALLGLFPITAKKLIAIIKNKKVRGQDGSV